MQVEAMADINTPNSTPDCSKSLPGSMTDRHLRDTIIYITLTDVTVLL